MPGGYRLAVDPDPGSFEDGGKTLAMTPPGRVEQLLHRTSADVFTADTGGQPGLGKKEKDHPRRGVNI
jgi:hypothetical protein